MTSSVVDQFFWGGKKKADFLQTKLIWVGSGLGSGLGLGLELVS